MADKSKKYVHPAAPTGGKASKNYSLVASNAVSTQQKNTQAPQYRNRRNNPLRTNISTKDKPEKNFPPRVPKPDFDQPRVPRKSWAQIAVDARAAQKAAQVQNAAQNSDRTKEKVRYSEPNTANNSILVEDPNDDVQSIADAVYVRDPVIVDYDSYFAKDISVIRQYLRDSGLEDNYKFMLKTLFSRGTIPSNPYPGFAQRSRKYGETFHMRDNIICQTDIQKILDYPYVDTGITYIVQSLSYDNIIGLPCVVRCINPFYIQDYERFVLDMLPKVSTLMTENEEYSIQVVGSLIGQAVFHGTFYEEPTLTEVRVEYIVTGARLDQAIKFFIDSVIADVNYMLQFSVHILMGFKIPIKIQEDNIWQYDFWSLDSMKNEEPKFRRVLTEAITHCKFFSIEMILRDQVYLDRYYRSRKEYGMNYLQSTEGQHSDMLSTFSEAPMMTLYQGFFYKKAHMEAYMSLYLPHSSVADPTINQETLKRHYNKNATGFGQKLREKLGITAVREDRKKVDIDGFLLEDDMNKFGPYGPQVTVPIKTLWQKKVATYHHYSEVFEAAHYVLLLALMERDAYHEELLMQLYRLFHSTAARFVRLLDMNKVIREMILNYLEEGQSSLVDKTFTNYRRQLKELLNSELFERSSDVHIMSRGIEDKLNKLVEKSADGVRNNIKLEPNTVLQLRYLNMFCSCLYAQLVEDAVHECPLVPEYITKMRELFPEVTGQIGPKTAEKSHKPHKMRSEMVVPHHATFDYGYEYQDLLDQDRKVIDIEMCMERDKAPAAVASESVLMRYGLDVHLDEVWSDYLQELLTAKKLPPNPYPKLVSHFRRAAMKMHLWFEDKDTIVARLKHDGPKLEDPENYIYHIPGCEAHAHISALTLLDTEAYVRVKRLMKAVKNTTFLQRKGPYKIAMTLALSGHSPLYGRVDPYLKAIELHEHCFIKGPDRGETEAITIYSKIVYEHLVDIIQKKRYPLIGFFLGDSKAHWNTYDIINGKSKFLCEFELACNNRQPLVMKICMLLDWQYIPVVKKHLFHYVNADESKRTLYYESNPILQYQNVFLQKEKAVFHFQQGATADGCSPFTPVNTRLVFAAIHKIILQELENRNWINVHRWLLTKSLINHNSNTHQAETWRMLHSVAGGLEYVNQLNVGIQELVYYAITEEEQRIKCGEEASKDHIGHLCLKSFGTMLQAYRDKLDILLKTSITMAPKMLADMMQEKLQLVTERNSVTDEIFVLISPKSLTMLSQVHQMTEALLNVVAEEIHNISPEAQQAVRSIQAEMKNRPVTVEPSQSHYRQPKITLFASKDLHNEWVL